MNLRPPKSLAPRSGSGQALRAVFLQIPAVLLLSCIPFAPGCAHPGRDAAFRSSEVRPPLTAQEAGARAKQVGKVRYALWFSIDGEAPEFEGRAVIQFHWKGAKAGDGDPLFLDFSDGTVASLKINTVLVPDEEVRTLYSGHRLRLPKKRLHPGLNRVEVAYSHEYGQDGVGLHRFRDPADDRVYLYSNAEPYDANRIFPCFDQPDLKAGYEVTVEAPADWAVISNLAERDVSPIGGRASWSFPPSPPFSTYLFALHAGPYAVWKSDAGGIPLRLFARESLKRDVDHREWFEITKAGLDYFQTRFGRPYPFEKYDQVLVPEFNDGAMENIGAVTFSDEMAFSSGPSDAELRERADTILHEMAHMWFGNLVTMKWWNGLWLNESFATHAANRALETLSRENAYLRRAAWARPYRDTPGSELFREKRAAYRADLSRATHPIEVPVGDTDEAESNFDEITYSKGAGVLKQLESLLGEEDFREGVQRYFERYAYRNTTQLDFIRALQEASAKPLEKWFEDWVASEGANTVEAQFSCDDEGRITKFELVQSNGPRSTRLRSHQTWIALHGRASKPPEVIPATYSGERTPIGEAVGKACPVWVNPNHEDRDYVQVKLDPATREFLARPPASDSPLGARTPLLEREQLWQSIWESTLLGESPPDGFVNLFFSAGVRETDPGLFGSLVRRLYSTSILEPSASLWLPPEDRLALVRRLHALATREILVSPPGGDLQESWWEVALLTSPEMNDASWILSVLRREIRIPGLPLDQDLRWQLLEAWSRIPSRDMGQFETALREEAERDPGESGRKWMTSIQSATASPEAKQAAFEKALSPKTSFSDLRALADSFPWIGQENLYPWLEDRFFAELPSVIATKSNEEAAAFTRGFFPFSCGGRPAERLARILASHRKLPASVHRSLESILEEEERCRRMKAPSNEGANPAAVAPK